MPEIIQWNTIRDRFAGGGLLLGNGASMAIHRAFGYDSLYEAAQQQGHITPAVGEVFAAFGTTDFELILRRLWQAQLVNTALGIMPGPVEAAYQLVRNALISTVRANHVSYEVVIPHFAPMWKFMKSFKTILSLNYDLTVYWAMMAGNQALGGVWFKDCFNHDEFVDKWQERRDPLPPMTGASLVFYPHGNLILGRSVGYEERKLRAGRASNLLGNILNEWETNTYAPLFVCEGTTEHKKRSIESSTYLHRVYREAIPAVGVSLVIYGWNASPQDMHICEQIKRARQEGLVTVAISVYGNNQAEAQRLEDVIMRLGLNEIVFFDAESPGCWVHQEDEAEE